MPWRCFLLEEAGLERIFLRRYSRSAAWTCEAGWHNAMSPALAEIPYRKEPAGTDDRRLVIRYDFPEPPHDADDWPTRCRKCGYLFQDTDHWQVFGDTLWRHAETGRLYSVHGNDSLPDQAPTGAIWDAWWLADVDAGPDGRSLMCRTPAGDWHIDGPASNCTLKGDTVHKCWVRHGTPPNLTVDKNGVTCAAGAGSILIEHQGKGHYHGFLQNGSLTDG